MFLLRLMPKPYLKPEEWIMPLDLLGSNFGFKEESDLDMWVQTNFPDWKEDLDYKKEEIEDKIIQQDTPIRTLFHSFNGFMTNLTAKTCLMPLQTKIPFFIMLLEGKVQTGKGDLQKGIAALTSYAAAILPYEGITIDRGTSKKVYHLIKSLVPTPEVPNKPDVPNIP